jgi:hypothetical protein
LHQQIKRDMVYLTKEIKEYYMNDFTNNVVNCSDEFWGLDEGLLKICTDINKNDNVQTLYSRRCLKDNDENNISFLWIMISEQADVDKINTFIRTLKRQHKFHTFMPTKMEINGLLPDIKIGATQDINYFQHGVIEVRIESKKLKEHNLFWETIARHLKNW